MPPTPTIDRPVPDPGAPGPLTLLCDGVLHGPLRARPAKFVVVAQAHPDGSVTLTASSGRHQHPEHAYTQDGARDLLDALGAPLVRVTLRRTRPTRGLGVLTGIGYTVELTPHARRWQDWLTTVCAVTA